MTKSRRTKPKNNPKPSKSTAELGERVAFRVSASMRDRLEKHARRVMLRSPGLHVSRSDAARMLLSEALDQAEHPNRDAVAVPAPEPPAHL